MEKIELYKVGDIVRVKPECIKEINYTNKPEPDKPYKIRCVFGGDLWTYGLDTITGTDANIHINHSHCELMPVGVVENVVLKK